MAPQLRARGIDAHNVYDLRQQGWSDAALLQSSAAAGRVVVTHNIRDFASDGWHQMVGVIVRWPGNNGHLD
ncbi:MAG: DUF5615 family PIN-like protein [Nitrospiraceae bacterium]|nr:DUF5615 family PIN-like protein [Nitrospiraceae bacterium]